MKDALIAVVIFVVALFASAGLLRLADIPAVIFGGVVAGIYLFAVSRRRAQEPPAPPPG